MHQGKYKDPNMRREMTSLGGDDSENHPDY